MSIYIHVDICVSVCTCVYTCICMVEDATLVLYAVYSLYRCMFIYIHDDLQVCEYTSEHQYLYTMIILIRCTAYTYYPLELYICTTNMRIIDHICMHIYVYACA